MDSNEKCLESYWKGYVARKESRAQLKDLHLRMQKSAKNVDDSKFIINRLLSALSVPSMKSISGILHHCETLDMATAHSLKCCEELVAVGAIGILLKQICSASQSIPDQQVKACTLNTQKPCSLSACGRSANRHSPSSRGNLLGDAQEQGVKAVHKLPAFLKDYTILSKTLQGN